MPQYKYQLAKGKHTRCPQCKHMSFHPYVSVVTGEAAGEMFGRCERINKCGYIEYPKLDPKDHEAWAKYKEWLNRPKLTPQPPKQHDFVPLSVVEQTFKNFNQNSFFNYLMKIFGKEKAFELQATYNLGTATNGGNIFWQQDFFNKFRTGKIMYYQPDGHRDKTRDCWYVHKKIKPDFELKQVFFGEHLLSIPANRDKPVALCESEKTAVIMSVIKPQYVWLAAGGATMIGGEKFHHVIQQQRKLTLFPDEGQYMNWRNKTDFISNRKIDTEVEEAFLNGLIKKGGDIWDLYEIKK